MDNFVRIYENVLEDELCDRLINRFELNPDLHIRENQLTAVHMMTKESNEVFGELMNPFLNAIQEQSHRYKKDCEIIGWPKSYGLEPPKMKRYMPGGEDRFDDHVDVDSLENCKRFLVLFTYLSDNDKGATVVNPKTPDVGDMHHSRCKKGSMLIFPPYWPWVHRGEPPIDTPKYIIGSYLHYV